MSPFVHTSVAQQVHVGPGVLRALPGVLRDLGVRQALLITSPGRAASEVGDQLRGRMGRAHTATFDRAEPHVPATAVQHAVMQARRDAVDGVVSLGGGSAVDLAKAVCFFLEQEAGTPAASFTDRPTVPHLAVPTTFCGAAYTASFALTDPHTRQKRATGGATTPPVVVLADVAAVVDTPRELALATGVAALAHAVEAAGSPHRTPEAEAMALAATARLGVGLGRLADAPDDPEVREACFTGAALAGRALQNAAPGAVHGLAELLGGRTGVGYGAAAAVLLAQVVRFNADFAGEQYGELARALVAADEAGGTGDVADALERLLDRLGLPRRLADLDVADDDLDAVARLSQGHPAVQANVRPIGEADARALLDDVA